jgi:hypothetical protein
MFILQMANTRNRVTANSAENNGENNNQDFNPLSHPPPTLEQVLVMQAASDHAADHGQPTCSTPSATTIER